jgi:PAT family beta-lactamase induction signal transducer AmpG
MAAPTRSHRALILLGTLYVAQGIPVGLGFIAFPAILRILGFSTEAIGLVGIIILPWALKFLWAPLVDRSGVRHLRGRRRWILPSQIVIALLYAGMAALPASAIAAGWPAIVILLLLNTASATQDIATDGFAIEELRGGDLAWANGLQIGGFSLGMLIGGAATVVVYDHGGWAPTFGALAGLALLGAAAVLVLARPKSSAAPVASDGRDAPSLRNVIRRPGALLMLSIAATFHFALAMGRSMQGPLLVDSGLPLTQIGIVNGTGVACIAVVAALLGSVLIVRLGARVTAVGGGLVAALSLALWSLAAAAGSLSFADAMAISIVNGLPGGIAYVAFFTLFMRWASLDQPGTDFTLLQCTESCSNIVAAAIAGQLASLLGYAGFFLITASIGVVLTAWIIFALQIAPPPPLAGAQVPETAS